MLAYGQFLAVAVNFLIVAAVLLLVVKAMNQLKRTEEEVPKPPEDPADVKLLTEIRDLLASARSGARVVGLGAKGRNPTIVRCCRRWVTPLRG